VKFLAQIREEAIRGLTEVTGTGFFGERQGGLMKREQAERFVDALLDASGAELRSRIAELRATLAAIALGEPPDEKKPGDAVWRLKLAQRAAEEAVLQDDGREAKARG
jgi:hypothetical protein